MVLAPATDAIAAIAAVIARTVANISPWYGGENEDDDLEHDRRERTERRGSARPLADGHGGGRSAAHAPTEHSPTRSTRRASRRWPSTTSASACGGPRRWMRSKRSPTQRIPPDCGLLSNHGDLSRSSSRRASRTPPCNACSPSATRTGWRWPECFESRSGWRADSRSYHGGRRPGHTPRGVDVSRPTAGCFAHARPVTDFTRGSSTRMQPVVCGLAVLRTR